MFYDTPDYELTETEKIFKYSNFNSGVNHLDSKIPWPEVEFLFGEDEVYQDIVADTMRIVTTWLTNTINFVGVLYSFLILIFKSFIIFFIKKDLRKLL